jgi:hypothetical protein
MTTSTTRRAASALAALTLLTAAALAGCSSGPSREDIMERLTTGPTLEQAAARYEEMQQRVRDRLDAEIGPFDWGVRREGSESLCGNQFNGLDAYRMYMPPWGFDGGIPDADWPRAQQVISEVTAEYGFGTPTLQIDEPGRHQTSSADLETGAQYGFRTQVNTTMQVTTGCHLRQADRSTG